MKDDYEFNERSYVISYVGLKGIRLFDSIDEWHISNCAFQKKNKLIFSFINDLSMKNPLKHEKNNKSER